MLSYTLLPLAMAAVAMAQSVHTNGLPAVEVPAGRPNFNTNRPVPSPNPDPKDTNNNRLVGKRFELNELPLKVDTLETERGIQVGVNQCNASTQNQQSVCQTIHVNSAEDFCIFIPQTVTPVGNAEAGMVAACTKPTHGARMIPAGALTGIKFYKAATYIGIAGKINQLLLNLPEGDTGGEVDSGGQDGRGNPIGGMAYSNSLPGSEGKVTQSVVWNQFIGGNAFCMKLCNNEGPDAANMCEHVYDTIGCAQNFPSEYADGVFESCASDDHIPVGYLAAAGRSDLPASSNCTPFQSASAYAGLPTPSGVSSSTTPGASGSASGTAKPTGTGKPSGTGSGSNPSSTSTPGDSAGRVSMAGVAAFLPLVAGLVGAYLV